MILFFSRDGCIRQAIIKQLLTLWYNVLYGVYFTFLKIFFDWLTFSEDILNNFALLWEYAEKSPFPKTGISPMGFSPMEISPMDSSPNKSPQQAVSQQIVPKGQFSEWTISQTHISHTDNFPNDISSNRHLPKDCPRTTHWVSGIKEWWI